MDVDNRSDMSSNITSESSKVGRPRLFIKEMVMRNFKSYAGEQRVGPFHKSFSAVVGPNGSGKSNVIDAMLFVFGKRAKQMRLNKVSELIHNSTHHQNLDSAAVSVHFQEIVDLDDGDYEVVPGSDFTITRVAFRDNSSKYFIDKRGSNFTEVTKLLKGKGVDLDNNRFLILQGEVEQISLMKPKAQGAHEEGFLEYLEDIIGTNKYVEKIEESSKNLELLDEKRSGVVQMVKLAEKERDSLEDVKNEAEAYMLKELLLLNWQEKAAELAADETASSISGFHNDLSILEEQEKSEKDKIKEKNMSLKELEAVHKKYMKRQEELDSELRSCRDEFKEFERQDVKYREDMKHLKQKIKKMEEKIVKDSLKISDLTKECENSTDLIPKLEADVPVLQDQLAQEEKVLENIEEKSKVETEKYRSELVKIREELEPWDTQLIDHRGKLDEAANEVKLLTEKHDSARATFEDAKKQSIKIAEKIEQKTRHVESLKCEIQKHKHEASESSKEEQGCIKEQESLIALEESAKQKVTELNAVVESEKNHGSVMKAIYQARDTGKIDGIYGRLGDLGAIEAKYDVAISTACAALDYIVVETTASAEACVHLLRKENLGVATFLIMEKQLEHLAKMKSSLNTPEGVPRLFDLVKVKDEKMRLAFYAMLGNTIVAKDLDQATRIAYGNNPEFRRVVTLDGSLFEKSGTMSGGGAKPRGGKMGTSIRAMSVSPEAMSEAQKVLTDVVNKLAAVRKQISEAAKRYQSSEKQISALEMELAKTQKEIESLTSEKQDLSKQLPSLEAACAPQKHELSRLEELHKIKTSEEKEINKLLKGSKQLKDKASELQSKIENAGGEKLKSQKAKVQKIQSDINNKSSEMNRHRVQIETGQKQMKKLTKGIEETKSEKERLQGDKEKMMSVFKEIEVKAFAVQENYKKTEKLIDQHREALEKTKAEYDNAKKVVDHARAVQVDAEFKVQDLKKSLKELESKRDSYKKKADGIKKAIQLHIAQIEKDLVDPEKLQATLAESPDVEASDLRKSLETVTLLEAQLNDMSPNLDSIAEYRRKVSLYNERVEELNAVTQERDEVKKQYDDWRKRRLDEFMEGFNVISLKLKEMYQMITLGGDAELELVDSLDPFSEGVVFSVRPPKKSWKNIANLSGGEKTLSSLAFVFALHHYKPTPLYVMDEIDAALDFKNVSIVGHYVKDRTKDAQFIIISLRNNMFELADRLVGIYKTDNCTKSITINPGSFVVCQETL